MAIQSFASRSGLLLVAVALFAGCAAQPFKAVQLNQKAKVYIEYQQYDTAIALLKKSLDSNHENSPSHYWLGRCYQATGNLDKAIYEYQLALRFDPSLDLAQVALIKTYHQTGRIDEALLTAKKYFEHKDAPARVFIVIADEFARDGMQDQVLLAYKQAQKLEPYNPVPAIAMADYYFTLGRTTPAVNSLSNAFRIDPYYPGLARKLGQHGMKVSIPTPKPYYPDRTDIEQKIRDLEL